MGIEFLYRIYGSLFARPALYRFNRALFNFSLRGLGVLNWESAHLQGEQGMIERVLRHAPKDAILFDVGANVGDYSAAALKIAPHLQVHAFEPIAANYQRLSRRLHRENVRCVLAAVGDRDGEAEIYDHAAGEGTSHATLQPGVIERIHCGVATTVSVPMISLETYVREQELSSIQLLKIDVEGREADVLRGAAGLLSDGFPIEFIQVEFNEMNVLSRTFLEDLVVLLPGYSAYRVLPGGGLIDITEERLVLREIFAFQNILFARSKLD